MCNIVADFITEQPQHARSRFAESSSGGRV